MPDTSVMTKAINRPKSGETEAKVEKLQVVTLFGTNKITLTLKRKFTAADANKEGHFLVVLDKVTLQSAAMKFVELKG